MKKNKFQLIRLENIYLPQNNTGNIIFFIVIGLITLFFLIGLLNLETNNDVTVLLPNNVDIEYKREILDQLNKEFPSDQMLFIGVEDAFNLDKIKYLYNLCKEIDGLNVVKSSFNPFNAIYFKKFGDNFTFAKTSVYPKTEEALSEFITNLGSNRYIVGSAISYDLKTAGIVVRMNKNAKLNGGNQQKLGFYNKFLMNVFGRDDSKRTISRDYFCLQVEKVINKYNPYFKIYYAGVPVYEAKTKEYMKRDMFILLIPAIFLMALTLFLTTRTKRGTLLPMACMLLSLVWTMGFLGWIRYKINIVGILMPPIILTIGSSYTLHYIHSYYINARNATDPRQLVLKSSKEITPTITMAALTTMVGFASFFTATIGVVREFGLFINLSILFTLFLTLFLLPRILVYQIIPHGIKVDEVKNDFFSKILHAINKPVLPFRYIWVGIFGLSFILFAVFMPHLKVETNAANYFREKDHVKQSLIFLQEHFGGTTSYNITLRSKENKKNFFKTRAGLLVAKKIQDYLDKNVMIDGHTMIGWNISPVTLIEDLNKVLYGQYGIPENETEIKRFFSYLKASGDDGIKSIINDDFSAVTFQVRALTDNEKENGIMTEQELYKLIQKITGDIKQIADQDGSISSEVWGEIVILSNISKYMIVDQVINIVSTFIFIFMILLILFKSVYYAIIGSTSHTFGVLMNFSIMSIFGIPLDSGTVMISAITIGVGVDAAIHFILNFIKLIKNGASTKEAIETTLTFTSRPIVFAAAALFFGFLVFILSSFKPIFYFGLLISLAMLTCTFANLFILPSLLHVSEKIRRLIHKDQ